MLVNAIGKIEFTYIFFFLNSFYHFIINALTLQEMLKLFSDSVCKVIHMEILDQFL